MEIDEITVESVEELVELIEMTPDGVILDFDLGKEDEDGT